MKNRITISRAFIVCFSILFFSFAAFAVNVDNRAGKIKLKKESDGTRSGSATEVSVYIDGNIITVETTGYQDSSILLEIFDEYDILQAFAEFEYDSFVMMDISSLPPGEYEIVVTLDYRYTGSFER